MKAMRTRKRDNGLGKKSVSREIADVHVGDLFSEILDMYAPPEFIRFRKISVGRAGFRQDRAAMGSYFRVAKEKMRE